MSRSNQYIKTNSSALLGSPTGIATVDVDMSKVGATEDITIHDSFSTGAQLVSCQAVAIGLSDTSASFKLIQSNDGENYVEVGAAVNITVTTGSVYTEKSEFSAAFLGVRLTKSSVNTGILRLVFVVKHK